MDAYCGRNPSEAKGGLHGGISLALVSVNQLPCLVLPANSR